MAITDESEIYNDLLIYGDDFFEFLIWLDKRFNVRLQGSFHDYVPGEQVPLFWLFNAVLRRIALAKPRSYRSLTVGDIVSAISAGHSNENIAVVRDNLIR